MSFLLDPPMLVASGVLIERVVPEEKRDLAEAATMGTFIGISVALYLEAPGLGMFWKPFGSTSGRDFMVNSGVFSVNTDEAGWRTDVVSAAIYATYPLFLKLGRHIGRRSAARSVSPQPVAPPPSTIDTTQVAPVATPALH
ncbi:MAG: hypothetical protein M5U31_07620 [Acidimicrobiia bacterium]|nr:hypothetical protein [Acidimicrobiia bacterium]